MLSVAGCSVYVSHSGMKVGIFPRVSDRRPANDLMKSRVELIFRFSASHFLYNTKRFVEIREGSENMYRFVSTE
jgi:hypothetical protein